MNEHVSLRLQLPDETTSATHLSKVETLCAPAPPLSLQDLVDNPCPALEIDYKSWRNLENTEDQSELARDIAAIANAGGGHIIFGFHEDRLTPTDLHPFAVNCCPARITGITAAYLDPPPTTHVANVRSARGDIHPVIRIECHGPVPVCAKRAGALTERGAVYIRRYAHQRGLPGPPRPETARAETASDWTALIRRCTRQDRDALLSQIDALLENRGPAPSIRENLLAWHSAARTAFLTLTHRSPHAERLSRAHYVLSYAIAPQNRLLEHAQLPEFLRRCAFDAQSRFGDGSRMFDPPYRIAARPRYVADPATGDPDTDFLETAWLRVYPAPATVDLWRVSPAGFASLVRDYTEDRPETPTPEHTETPWLSASLLARELAELLWHANSLARFFPAPAHVVARCEWWGLAGRVLSDHDAAWARTGTAIGDHRAAWLDLPLAGFANAWAGAVSRLMAPLIRAFEPDLAFDADWVRERSAAHGGAKHGLSSAFPRTPDLPAKA